MSTVNQSALKIRFFEYPQVLVSLEPFKESKKFFQRHIKDICPIILDMTPNHDLILEECRRPQTVKIQLSLYITGNNSPSDSEKVLDIMQKSSVIKPCKVSTVARILLARFESLPSFMTNSDFCLAILPADQGNSFRINFCNRTARYIESKNGIITSCTPLIMETKPV